MKKLLKGFLALILAAFLVWVALLPKPEEASTVIKKQPAEMAKAFNKELVPIKKTVPVEAIKNKRLDVPLLKQMDAPRLYNGCEVTSLAMVLSFEGINVSKNELANKIKRVPLKYNNGLYGSPYAGFVGNMENGPGLGVYHPPIFNLAKEYTGSRAEDLTGQSFDAILKKLASGSPVWVITNTSYAPLAESSFKTWNTPEGKIKVTFQMHSVAITGFDENYIYVNDPYGTKDRKVNRENFIKAWVQMGSQAIVIN